MPAPAGPRRRTAGRFVIEVLEAADRNSLPFMASAFTFDAMLATLPFLALALVALTLLVGVFAQSPQQGIEQVLDEFMPHRPGGSDSLAGVRALLVGVSESRGAISYIAVPTFFWFSTRLFASIRTALGKIYHAVIPPPPARHFVLAFLRGKLHDFRMVGVVLVLLVANVGLTTVLAVLRARSAIIPRWLWPLFGLLGGVLSELVAFGASWLLAYVLYRYSAPHRPSHRSSLVGAACAALAFEVAKLLYGLYIQSAVTVQGFSTAENLGALLLFVLWIYYTGIVLFLGACIAVTLDAWQSRTRGLAADEPA